MANHELRILAPTDSGIVNGFARIVESLDPPSDASLEFRIGTGRQPTNWTCSAAELSEASFVQQLAVTDATAISFARLSKAGGEGTHVTVERGPEKTMLKMAFPDGAEPEVVLPLLAAATSAFKPFDSPGNLESILVPELARFHEQREALTSRLEHLTEQVIRRNEDYRLDLDRKFDERVAKLNAEHERLETQLRESWGEEEKVLSEREDALHERAAELDDRASTHARRELRRDLKNILDQRSKSFQLTEDTAKKRWPIHALFIFLIVVLGAYAMDLVVDQFQTATPPDLTGVFRAALGIISLSAAIGFYIRWNDLWARRHAEEEFRLRQLELDVDRASWVVEMALEWKEEKDSEIPAGLVARLSHGLFERSGEPHAEPPAAEDLTSALLRAASGMNLTLPGFGTVSIDRKGLKQFSEAADVDE